MRRALLVGLMALATSPAVAQTPAEIRDAVVKALAPVQKAQEPWFTANKQVCASCHHQYQGAVVACARAYGPRGYQQNDSRAQMGFAFA